MHIKRLRLLGFKSFVEPTELIIEPGLTGVVGPNGCGKSNLLEALRWVMGETSYKSMRASAMDDVIFGGSQGRPARNTAEVTIFLDNTDRKAPPQFNDSDLLEVTRRIEREAGSAYRINGSEARARDVKILFEDAATGARSPALVRQGQISEIVNAKPTDRRRILEDAAGIAGLHSRRHEAELRLRAAETNLTRLKDVLGQMGSQLEGLKRQARAAKRYKELSTEIRAAEAIHMHLVWTEAQAQVIAEEAALESAMREVGIATQLESESLRAEATLAEELPGLREEEAVRGAVLQRLKVEEERLAGEERQAEQRLAELDLRLRQLRQDLEREEGMIGEAADTLGALVVEAETLDGADKSHAALEADARERLKDAAAVLEATEEAMTEVQGALADERARRRQVEASVAEQARTEHRLAAELEALVAENEALAGRSQGLARVAALAATVSELGAVAAGIEEEALASEETTAEAAVAARRAREEAGRASLRSSQLATEIQTLRKLLAIEVNDEHPPIVDKLSVDPGFEMALGAALGDDLVAPADEAAPLHWRRLESQPEDAGLPEGIPVLADHVRGAPELVRRLRQIGIVEKADGPRLQGRLAAGQRLVTREGDLWRWDGFTAGAHAPTAAALRLAERNRLAALEADGAAAHAASETASAAERTAAQAHAVAEAREKELRARLRETNASLAKARDDLAAAERAARETHERLAALGEARQRTSAALEETRQRKTKAEEVLAGLPSIERLDERLRSVQAQLPKVRADYTELGSTIAALEREQVQRAQRRSDLARDRERWQTRAEGARRQVEALKARISEAAAEHGRIESLPAEFADRRGKLMSEVSTAEAARRAAADRLAETEGTLRAAQSRLKEAREAVAAAREGRARVEARLEAARTRRTEQATHIQETLQCAPDQCLALVGVAPEASLPSLVEIDRQLQRLRADRERLGGVNLSADDELTQLTAEFDGMDRERAEMEEAIAKLRGGIGQLNKEGRARLMAAFDTVNGHFQRLFTTLFNGGEARLEMIESEDPLEGGLEIVAKPPGKKPATLSLLSGGEQTLTALSLIFAVFLTNPSPICVLDEVDAPLDDANVDRFCTMMEHMARDTDTRFLVITHHPMTMARMNRLFGVTMQEKGVSQLVSVDLATAERFREAV